MATGNIIIPPTYSGATSLGTIGEMQAAQIAQQAQAATVAQQRALATARLGGLPQAQVPAIPGGASGIPQQALNPMQQSLMSQLQTPVAAPAALEAGPPVTRAGMLNAARAQTAQAAATGSFQTAPQGLHGSPQLADTLVNDVSALRSSAPAAASEASGFAKYFPSLAGAAEGEGALAKGAGFLASGSKAAGLAKGIGIGFGAPIAGQLLGAGSDAIGAPSEVGGALRGAGTGVGIGSIFGAPGMVVGGVVGGSVGALSGPVQDAQWASHYDDEASKTAKYARTLTDKDAVDIRTKFGHATQAIQAGNNNKFAKVTGLAGYDVSTMQGRALALQALNHSMSIAAQHPNHWRDQLQAAQDAADGSGGGTASKAKKTAVQIQMGQAMAQYAKNSIAQGDAQSAALQQMAADPNMAAIAPIINADAAGRAASGRQMADAYTTASYGDLQSQQAKSQQSYINQLEQQLQATRTAAQGSGSSSSLADQVKNLVKKTS